MGGWVGGGELYPIFMGFWNILTLQSSEAYSKSFDSVDHVNIFDTMIYVGFPMNIIALIQSLYRVHCSTDRWNNEQTVQIILK